MSRRNVIWPGLVLLLFFGALFWAREQDPFSRKWFTLKTADGESFQGVAVVPKPMRQYPVIVYAHGSGDDLMRDGFDLRQMAEMGLAVVSLGYDKTNAVAFGSEFEALIQYARRQKWADTNAMAWVGLSLGANLTLDFARKHPQEQPRLLAQLSGAGLVAGQETGGLERLRCPVLLIHGDQDELFPAADTQRLASFLQSNGAPVELKMIAGAAHGMGLDRGAIFRGIGEYCREHLAGKAAWENYHSIAQWEAQAPGLWLYWIPAAAWAAGWFVWWRIGRGGPTEKTRLSRKEKILRWLAVLLATGAAAETAIHLVTPHFSVNEKTLLIARRFLVEPKGRADFEYLAAKPIWRGEKLKTLLTHVELAGYTRELINWKLDDKDYRDFVLSPVITGAAGEELDWRRPLWEEFYPRIRHEALPEEAARIVARHLRERVTVGDLPGAPREVPAIWLRQITGEAGFENIYVAALRSAGVPARLNASKRVEFWNGALWQAAPRPVLEVWPPS